VGVLGQMGLVEQCLAEVQPKGGKGRPNFAIAISYHIKRERKRRITECGGGPSLALPDLRRFVQFD